ncbi:hypothetical protein HanRHA438_Chr04g0179071 [Helianthus annuus]|nr:hypothetical protein HanRHA438_Chr04g0179071 [Helianthus annuus]
MAEQFGSRDHACVSRPLTSLESFLVILKGKGIFSFTRLDVVWSGKSSAGHGVTNRVARQTWRDQEGRPPDVAL